MRNFLMTALIAFSIGAHAQEQNLEKDKRDNAKWEALDLTPEQKTKIENLRAKHKPQKTADGERPSREEMEKRRAEMDKEMQEILTKEQYEKYRSTKRQSITRKPETTRENTLNLSKDQKKKIAVLKKNHFKKIRESRMVFDAEMKDILSATQYQKWQDDRQSRQKRHHKRS